MCPRRLWTRPGLRCCGGARRRGRPIRRRGVVKWRCEVSRGRFARGAARRRRGEQGAGRTAASGLASRCGAVVREFVLDEACDARALVGYHEVAEDGRFSWRRGPLALAVERGEWAVVEDVDRASLEVLALLKPLAEGFSLGAAGRALASESVRRHAGFRLLGTATTEEARFLGREHWVEAYCRPLDRAELMAIVGLPASVAAAVVDAAEGSARDAIKMARRVRDRVNLEEGPYAPEAKRLLAAVEACDVVLGRCRGDAAEAEANVAEAFGLEPDHLRMRVRASSPQITSTPAASRSGAPCWKRPEARRT